MHANIIYIDVAITMHAIDVIITDVNASSKIIQQSSISHKSILI